jgi:hypothetical protein
LAIVDNASIMGVQVSVLYPDSTFLQIHAQEWNCWVSSIFVFLGTFILFSIVVALIYFPPTVGIEAVVNGIIFLISFSVCSLLVYRKATDFYMLIFFILLLY